MSDLISRQAAIDAIESHLRTAEEPYYLHDTDKIMNHAFEVAASCVYNLPSAQPERLTDDDFETIRIHLNAYKEKLCNQQRWEEAEEYQRIIDRLMAFASAQPEVIRCKDCKWYEADIMATDFGVCCHPEWVVDNCGFAVYENGWCYRAERRTDE